jgi:hypothetical protein
MIDPVSGTPVPPGALPQEVRDDVPINASEGEYVLPADVVRYIGLDKIEKMVNQAKKGIGDMAQGGRIGGEPPSGGEPPMPQGMPPEAPMFNEGGLITAEDRAITDTTGQFDPTMFNPRSFVQSQGQGQGAQGEQRVQKFVGPDGRVLYIPLNTAGQLVFAPPAGFRRAAEPPKTEREAVAETTQQAPSSPIPMREPSDNAMWSDGLTGAQIREEQANRTFRTYEQLNPNVGSGQLPGFMGDLMSGITGRISGAFDKLTSGEALGAIAQVALTLAGSPLLGTIAGGLIDKYNEKRKQEGLPEVTVEQVAQDIAPVARLSTSQVVEIANNAATSPSNLRTSNAATQEGVLDLDSYTLLGTMGTPEDPSFMVRGPDGSIMTVKPGDEIDGVTFQGLMDGVGDPVGRRLSDVAILSGQLPSGPSQTGTNSVSALGRNEIGFGSLSGSPTGQGGSSSPTPTSRGLSPTSGGVSFNTSGGSDRSAAEQASASGVGGRTSSGGSVGGSAASSGFSQGQSTVGNAGVGGAFSGSLGSVGTGGTSSSGLSMGTSVSPGSAGSTSDTRSGGFSSSQQAGTAPSFNKGGLVNSPYKSYDITKGYKKGGLVKRNK